MSRQQEADQQQMLYGYHPVREALRRRPQEIRSVWVALRTHSGRRKEIEALCERHRVPVEQVHEQHLREKAGHREHNGFGAIVQQQLDAGAGQGTDSKLIVLLEDIQDPRNLGALFRACEGAGVGKVLVRDRGTAPISPVVEKTAVGASQWLDIERITNPAREIRRLKQEGFWVYGADVTGDPVWEVDLTGPVVLCLGGESKGLRLNTRNHCDRLVSLPMKGRIESLNVASACAVLLYDALRQRTAVKNVEK